MRVVLADKEPRPGGELRRVILGEGLTCEAEDVVEYRGLAARLAAAAPDLVLVCCNGSLEEALEAIRTAHQMTALPVFAVGEALVSTVRGAMRAGAKEFLDVSHFREDLSQSLIRIEDESSGSSRRGKIVALYSPIGGAGVSTIAINLAASLAGIHAQDGPGKVALLDLNAAPSDLSILLDLEPRQTVDDLCSQWERLDQKMLAAAAVPHSSGIDVLAQAGYPSDGGIPERRLSPAGVRQILAILRRMYAMVVVDLDHALAAPQVEAMRQSNLVGVVVRPDVPGLRRVHWAVDAALKMGVSSESLHLLLNRCEGRRHLKPAKVEETLHRAVFHVIPENPAVVTEARNCGTLLLGLSKASGMTRNFSELARHVLTCTNGKTV